MTTTILPPLLNVFSELWLKHIQHDVLTLGMTSERALQGSIYYHLRQRLNGDTRILIEPRIHVGHEPFVPDMLVLTSTDDALFIEIKLQNSAGQGIVWETDFKKFGRIEAAARSGNLQIPGRGRTGPLQVPPQRMYLFVAVGDESCRALQPEWLRQRVPKHVSVNDIRCFWAGGVTDADKAHFLGPEQVTVSETP